MRDGRGRPRGGFTLIEVLLAITLLGIMVTVGFAVLRVGAGSWNAGEARFEQAERQTIALGFLRAYLANVQPAIDDFSADKPRFTFIGNADAMQFVAFPPDHAGHGMRYRFLVYTEDGALRIAMEPFGKRLLSVADQPERMILLEGVRGLRLAYFGRHPRQPLPQWWDKWRFPHLPELIHITVETDQGLWESVVAPRLATPE